MSGLGLRPLSVDLTPAFPITPSPSDSSVESAITSSSETGTPTQTRHASYRCRNGILITDGIRTRSTSLPPSGEHSPLDSDIQAMDSLQSSPGTSTSSLRLNVKFAPLPELPSGRRRKNTTPLGVASRGQMMRRRRAVLPPQQQQQLGEASPLWTHEEVEAHLRRQQAGVHMTQSPADELEDPLLTFGRKLRGAWRKVAKGKEKERAQTTQTPVMVAGERRIVLATIEPNESEEGREEGRVWEEEIGEKFVTETVRASLSDGDKQTCSNS